MTTEQFPAADSEEGKALLALSRTVIERIILAERARIKAILLEHEPLAGPYIHDLIRAIDEGEEIDAAIGVGGGYLSPVWEAAGRIHDWRNYVSEELQEMWDTFTPEQKAAIYRSAEQRAEAEDWD